MALSNQETFRGKEVWAGLALACLEVVDSVRVGFGGDIASRNKEEGVGNDTKCSRHILNSLCRAMMLELKVMMLLTTVLLHLCIACP